MELVFKEPTGLVWHYADGIYYRKKGDDVVAMLSGQHIPDPYVLWQRKCSAVGKEYGQNGYTAYRPQEAVFRLWEHWQNVNHNN